jgi:P2 family phage contractile tail tube protein
MPLPKVLKNINLFADGRNYMGKVTSMTPPKLKTKDEDYRGGGMGGPVSFAMGYEKLSCSWSLAETDKHLLKLSGLMAQHAVNVQFRGVVDDEQGNVGSIVFTMRGRINEADPGELKPGEKNESKFAMEVNFYEMKVNGELVHYIDVINNVWLIGGVDQMIAHRAILEGGDAGTARALLSALGQFAASKLS